MVTVQAKIRASDGHESLLPIVIPDIDDVREFAGVLHARAVDWEGGSFGWKAEYHAEKSESPLGSRLPFTPAEFCIGESGVWFFSMMWERGSSEPPVEFLDESGIIRR